MKNLFWKNFLSGMCWGVGSVVGASLVISLILGVLRYVNFVPIFGSFASQIVSEVEENRLRR